VPSCQFPVFYLIANTFAGFETGLLSSKWCLWESEPTQPRLSNASRSNALYIVYNIPSDQPLVIHVKVHAKLGHGVTTEMASECFTEAAGRVLWIGDTRTFISM
jgi:hypothetical protein